MIRKVAIIMVRAAATPSQIHLRASRRSDFTANAISTITTMPASRPSRMPISPLPTIWVTTDGPPWAMNDVIGLLPHTVVVSQGWAQMSGVVTNRKRITQLW